MRRKKLNLRGSVTQNAPVRLRARESSRFGLLLRFSALAGSLVIMVGITMWLWHIGWPQKQVEHMLTASLHATQKAHFSVEDIQVEGRQQTSKEALSAALGVASGAPILAFDPAAAQERIVKLPWVAAATVERRLPDTIIVRLSERTPLARWQHEGRTVIIDAEGKELPGAQPEQFTQLPLVVGIGAPPETKALLDALKDAPAVTRYMTAATRVSERRWDIYLNSKVVAKLPENNVPAALKHLSQLITEQNVLDLDVAAIDLRVPGRLVIEPGSAASAKPAEDKRL
jgi:cell division protein FtsQ